MAGHVRHQGLNEVSQFCRLDHLVPHQRDVVLAEVEYTFRGVSLARAAAVKGKLSHAWAKQLDSGRVRLGSLWSVLWVKKRLDWGLILCMGT